MSILVVGSVAYDSVETPFGRADRVLGGAASFFSVAASFFTPVRLVAVVGDDFGDAQLSAFASRDIDLTGLERASGKTFFWEGKYSYDLNARETLTTELNVFENFDPKIPESYRGSDYVFLANIDPVLQSRVLEQVEKPKIVACDTMNYWIGDHLENLKKTLERVDILLINDAEARQLSGEWNIVKAARAIREMGPHTLIIKKGEHGVLMFSPQGAFAAPAYPLEKVFDPTGAGDTFGGGFLGYLASAAKHDEESLRQAVVMGSALASFCVEAFSLDRLVELRPDDLQERFQQFKELTHFEAL